MKYSIKRQMTSMFVGLAVGILLVIFILNACFLEQFYITKKKSEFIDFYQLIQDEMIDKKYNLEEVAVEVFDYAEMMNISYIISDSMQGKAVSNVQNMDYLQRQLLGQLLNTPSDHGKILVQKDKYTIVQMRDELNQIEYISMWGILANGNMFLMRSPLQSIQESAMVSNEFLLYIGVVVLIIGITGVWILTKRFTEPIMELADISNKMADLDFDTKYTSGGKSEIGLLGANFNRMSERLEETISQLKSANNQLQKDIESKEKLEEMRTEFLGNVSHELKTPIALIQGYAEGLKDGVNEDEEGRDFYCDVIIDEAKKMNGMVRNLLTLNQLEFGNEKIEFMRVNLTEIVKNVLQSMEIIAQQKQA